MQNEEHKPGRPDHHIKDIAHDALHDLTHFDSNLLRTLPVLVLKPGKLTQATMEGKQADYVKPFALFVFLNFLFFLVKGKGLFNYTLNDYTSLFHERISEACSELHISAAMLTERFNTAMHFEQKEYLIVMVPLFALAAQLLFITQRRHYAQHLVFSLHFYAFFIIVLILVPYVFAAMGWTLEHTIGHRNAIQTEVFLTGLLLLVNFVYLLLATRLFYAESWLLSIIKSITLSFTVLLVVYVFRTLLFFVVMHAIAE